MATNEDFDRIISDMIRTNVTPTLEDSFSDDDVTEVTGSTSGHVDLTRMRDRKESMTIGDIRRKQERHRQRALVERRKTSASERTQSAWLNESKSFLHLCRPTTASSLRQTDRLPRHGDVSDVGNPETLRKKIRQKKADTSTRFLGQKRSSAAQIQAMVERLSKGRSESETRRGHRGQEERKHGGGGGGINPATWRVNHKSLYTRPNCSHLQAQYNRNEAALKHLCNR